MQEKVEVQSMERRQKTEEDADGNITCRPDRERSVIDLFDML